MTNFAEELPAAAAEAPDRPAVKLDDLPMSYGATEAAVALAAGLRKARPGAPVSNTRPSFITRPRSLR